MNYTLVKNIMNSDLRRVYHSYDHVQFMLNKANDFYNNVNIEAFKSISLKNAILVHDLVYDEKPDKELRSIELARKLFNIDEAVFELVKTTIYPEGKIVWNELTLLDLYGFIDNWKINANLIILENSLLYPQYSKDVLIGKQIEFLEKMIVPENFSTSNTKDLGLAWTIECIYQGMLKSINYLKEMQKIV